MTLGAVAATVHGELGGDADPAAPVVGPVEFDSRLVTPGCLFLALPGEHADGHDFAAGAVAAGAVAALVTRPVSAPHILVGDGLAALADLAAASVRRLPDLVTVGITGSSGKTSTKDLVGGLLERLGPTLAPRESFNNELGHPYTVLQAGPDTRYLVLELSARGLGHIAYLTRIAPPRIGVVLNVGSAHLGEFGSRAAIAQAKGELVEALPADGLAILNADDPAVIGMAPRTRARIRTVGRSLDAEVRAEAVRLDGAGRAGFTLSTVHGAVPVALQLVGEHHVGNALAAAAVALECGLALPEVAAGLAAATPRSVSRMAVSERADGVTLIDDAYNANPESTAAALRSLVAVGAGRRTVAVLGEMAELGEATAAAHAELGRLAEDLGVDRVYGVGRAAEWITDARPLADVAAAVTELRAELRPGDVVLVKASKAAGLRALAAAIRDDASVRPAQ